jgi:hypothetical protein
MRAVVGAVLLSLITAPAAEAACATASEIAARRVRLLQTELMVAALSCRRDDGFQYGEQYNAFVTKFRGPLKQHASVLKQEYRRTYGAKHQAYLDRYVTEIANDASERSLHAANYCASVRPLFDEVLTLKASDLPRFSERIETAQLPPAVACAAGTGKQPARKPTAAAP